MAQSCFAAAQESSYGMLSHDSGLQLVEVSIVSSVVVLAIDVKNVFNVFFI